MEETTHDAVRKCNRETYFELFEVNDSREIHWGLDFQLSLLGHLLRCVYTYWALRKEMVAAFLSEKRRVGPSFASPSLYMTHKTPNNEDNRVLRSVLLQKTHILMHSSLGQFPEICKYLCVTCLTRPLVAYIWYKHIGL